MFRRPIVTRVDPLKGFYAAEGYHQDYLVHNPREPYIVLQRSPEDRELKRVLPEMYQEQPVLTAAR